MSTTEQPSRITRPLTVQPSQRNPYSRRRRLIAYGLAVAAPVGVAVVLIPFRESLAQSEVLILLLPVIFVASVGGWGPSILAALMAAGAFDFFLTEPYLRPAIDDSDDVTAAVLLLIVGVLIGAFTQQLAKLAARSATRAEEIEQLQGFMIDATRATSEEERVTAARQRITRLLHLERCEWRPGAPGPDAAVLMADGEIMGPLAALPDDRSRLPADVELPVTDGATPIGRFVAGGSDELVSFEERRAASVILVQLGHELRRRS